MAKEHRIDMAFLLAAGLVFGFIAGNYWATQQLRPQIRNSYSSGVDRGIDIVEGYSGELKVHAIDLVRIQPAEMDAAKLYAAIKAAIAEVQNATGKGHLLAGTMDLGFADGICEGIGDTSRSEDHDLLALAGVCSRYAHIRKNMPALLADAAIRVTAPAQTTLPK